MISYSNQHIAGIFYLKAWDAVTILMSDISVILEEKSYDYEWASSPSHCNEDYIYIISWKQKVVGPFSGNLSENTLHLLGQT